MSGPDRSAELEEQRKLIATHLAWLDREIARERKRHPESASAEPTSRVQPTRAETPILPGPESFTLESAAEVVPLYEPQPPPSKQGCWLVFAVVMILTTAVLGALIYWRYGTS